MKTLLSLVNNIFFTERKNVDWNEYKKRILSSLSSLKTVEIVNDISTKPKLRVLLHRLVTSNTKIFKEEYHEHYVPNNGYDITFNDRCKFVEDCVKILSVL